MHLPENRKRPLQIQELQLRSVSVLCQRKFSLLQAVPRVTIGSSRVLPFLIWRNEQLPGLLSLSFPGKDGEAILHRMDLMGISISTGSACDSVNTKISHVLQAVQLNTDYAKGTIRISLGKNNTEDDIEKITSALIKIIT